MTNRTLTPLQRDFKAARFCSVPLVAIDTPDPAATLASLLPVMTDAPIVAWDLVRGIIPVNDAGQQMLTTAHVGGQATINPTEALQQCLGLPQMAVVVFYNLHLHIKDPGVIQALSNVRDPFKMNRRTILMLGIQTQLPAELAGDVIILDEPLPTRAELGATVDQIHVDAGLPQPTETERRHILDAIVGLAPFTAEQVLALSLEGPKSPTPGVSLDRLWARKCKAIQATDGLSVWRGGETFADLQGIDAAKDFMQDYVTADAFGVVVFIDEMDKALSGGMSEHTGDSGVAKDQAMSLLTYIEDTKSPGILLAGEAGCGKSALAKATGNAAGKVTIAFDLGGMKGGTVGQSERAIRQALKVITATAEGRVLFVATANNSTIFTPEINRRFPDQFYFQSPDDAGRAAIWAVYAARYTLTAEQAAFPVGMDAGWTGAEIERVCRKAALLKKTVPQVAVSLVPQAVSQAGIIAKMRENAAGRFLSASKPGFYTLPSLAPAATAPTMRRLMQES